jgi:hypothetical protein
VLVATHSPTIGSRRNSLPEVRQFDFPGLWTFKDTFFIGSTMMANDPNTVNSDASRPAAQRSTIRL